MATTRVYIPSRSLLRALARPLPPRCPFARSLTSDFVRSKRTQAAKTAKSDNGVAPRIRPLSAEQKKLVEQVQSRLDSLKDAEEDNEEDLDEDLDLESNDFPIIKWFEQDLHKGTPPRLIQSIETAEDRRKDREMGRMIKESWDNPNYDDTMLNRALVDSLLADPSFADLTQELQEIKEGIKSKKELEELEEQEKQEAEAESKQFEANMRIAAHQALQDLIDDPDLGDSQEDLRKMQANLSETDDIESPEFQAALGKAMARLNNNEAFQRKMAAMEEEADPTFEKEWEAFEKNVEEAIDEDEPDDDELDLDTPEGMQNVEKLMHEMRDILKSLDGEGGFQDELDAVLNDKSETLQQDNFEGGMDPEELVDELNKFATSEANSRLEVDEEDVSAELQAKVDKIMEDPKLIEKLMYIRELIFTQQQEERSIIAIAHETAQDPYSLESSRTTTLKERMQIARNNASHVAALERLRVTLLAPFNISPALKMFNQAIELAYIGANDDIRRILWRAYIKARTLPTFLQSVSDETWDIMYYSQAVKWEGNQNRTDHLQMLLADLKSLGRNGPPTHPSTLVKQDSSRLLEV